MKFFNTKLLAVFLISFSIVSNAFALEQGTLQVTEITPTQTLAIPDGNFDNGWQWIFNITIPNNETVLRLKFANWTSGTTTIPTATNVRFWSPQSSDTNSTSTAKVLSSANVYSDTIKLDPSFDLSPSTLGRQIQVVVEVRVPTGTTGGSYASSYGVSTDIDPNQATGVVQYNVDPNYANISINGNQTQQIIGQVLVTAQNEDIKLNTLRIDPKFTSSTTPTFSSLRNIKILLNGNQIGSSTDWVLGDGPNPFLVNLDSDVILSKNVQKTLTVKSDINFLESSTVSTGTLFTVLGGLNNNAQGVTTNKLISVFAIPFISATNTLTNYPALSDISISVTDGFQSTIKTPNTTQVKIGSYTIQTGNSEAITINSIKVNLSGTAITNNQITNLILKDGSAVLGTPIGNPISGINNFSANITIPSNTSKVVEVYADTGSASSNTNVTTSMSSTIRGNVSNIIKEIPETIGPSTSFAVAEIQSDSITTVASLNPVNRILIGQSNNVNIVTYNVKTSNNIAGAVIRDLKFIADNGITSITVNGITTSVIGTSTTIYNVNIQVPQGSSGINIPVSVAVSCVGMSVGCPINSSDSLQLHLVQLTYNDGSTMRTVSTMADSNSYVVYGTKPVITSPQILAVGLVLGAENKVGEVTVSADVTGAIKLNKIRFNLTSSGINGATINSSRIADGNTTISNSTCIRGGSLPEYVECTFTEGYTISAGTSKTFNFFTTVTGTSGANVTNSVSSTISPNDFLWTDVVGNRTEINASNIYNFPTSSYTLRQ